MKTCAIHQPNFFPWLGYFYKIAHSDVFVILDTVDIEIGTADAITNRTRIKTSSGIQWLTMPVRRSGSKLIKDVVMDNTKKWRETMLKTIYFQYKKSANFTAFYPLVESWLKYDTDNMSEYNTYIIKQMCKYMAINTPIVLASELGDLTMDRNMRLIDICQQLNCEVYLSGNGGKKYHNEQLFSDSGVTVKYTDFVHPEYTQLHGEFIKGLSAMDYCFNNINVLWK